MKSAIRLINWQLHPLLDHRQHIPAVNRRADFRIERHDVPALWRFHFILHLHRFNDGDAGSASTLSPTSTSTRTTFPGIGATMRAAPSPCAPTVAAPRKRFGIGDRDRMSIRADDHIEGLPRLRPAFNHTIKDLRR